MRALIQRVKHAAVHVDNEVVGAIDQGLLVFACVMHGDTEDDRRFLARKLTSLRIFADDAGKMNRSVQDVGGRILLVSQFTLAADIGKGARPSFTGAMAPAAAAAMFQELVADVATEVPVATGRFAADMRVELVNDGPVTLWLDSRVRGKGNET